jgi:hypothetical protein
MIDAPPVAPQAAPANPRKKIAQRRTHDGSQRIRRAVQLAFLALNIWIGVEFYAFVRFYETGGQSVWMARPSGIEG